MDQNELFSVCRHGNLERVKYLVEEREIELNVRDSWDSTPLYYACLCGHTDLVQYLLEQGARCDSDSFDGERCLYGALTGEIRRLLVQHKAITSQTIRRNPYEEFLRRMLETGSYSDVVFEVHGEQFQAHRCVLAARSEYFKDHFCHKWRNRPFISNNHPLVDPAAFGSILQYIYTGRLDVNVALVDDCLRLARQFRLEQLDKKLSLQKSEANFFVKTKYSTRISTLVIEPNPGYHELHHNMGQLAKFSLPSGMLEWLCGTTAEDLEDGPDFWNHLADVIFTVKGEHFRCHKALLCSRSEYFRALLSDHFHESRMDAAGIPLIEIHDVSIQTFTIIVFYIYQDFATIPPEYVFEVLYTAEIYLLPGLKKQCGAIIADNLDSSCVVGILKTARLLQLVRLQSACVEFIARNLEMVLRDPSFRSLILEDAHEVKNREETDTIDVIDDIRYFITGNVQTFSQMSEAQERLLLIDALLEELGLDA